MNKRCRSAIYTLCMLGLLVLAYPPLLTGQSPTSPNVIVRTIHGTITNASGEPLSGVTIRVKGTTLSTTSLENGQYQLAINNEQAILVFSFVGFTPTETVVGNRTIVDIQLVPVIKDLEG